MDKSKVAQKIIRMADEEQSARFVDPIDWDLVKRIDKKNRTEIKKIVEKYGLIKISEFGRDASFKAWLIIQHFPESEVEFMDSYLKLMEASQDDVDIRNIAYLRDRVKTHKGVPQIYGTQRDYKDGKEIFYEIEDIENVDKRRKEMNLDTLREYVSFISEDGTKVPLPDGYK